MSVTATAPTSTRSEPGWLQRNRMTITPLLFLLPGVLFFMSM